MITEIIGYLASVLIAVSLLMVNIVWLRLLNLAGCLAFITYGILIRSVPIGISNGFILLINLYYLRRLLGRNLESFTYIPLGEGRRSQVEDFGRLFAGDIRQHFPLFSLDQLNPAFQGRGKVYLALKQLKPVGLSAVIPLQDLRQEIEPIQKEMTEYISRELFPESTAFVLVDYIQKKYRNIGVDRKMYGLMQRELPETYRFIATLGETGNRPNDRYLKKNGYKVIRTFGTFSLYLKTRADQPYVPN